MFHELRNSVKDYKWYTASEVNNHTWSDEEMNTFYDIIKEFVKKHAPGVSLDINFDDETTGCHEFDTDTICVMVKAWESIDDNVLEIIVHETYHAINHRRRNGRINFEYTGSNEDPEEIAARGWSAYRQLAMKLSDAEIIVGLKNPKLIIGKSELFDQYYTNYPHLLKPFLKSVYKALTGE
jgi:hypothetical protein